MIDRRHCFALLVGFTVAAITTEAEARGRGGREGSAFDEETRAIARGDYATARRLNDARYGIRPGFGTPVQQHHYYQSEPRWSGREWRERRR